MDRSPGRIAAVAAVLVLAACGGGEDSVEDTAASDPTSPSDSPSSAEPSAAPTIDGDAPSATPSDRPRPNRSDRPDSSDAHSESTDTEPTGEGDEPSRTDLRSALLTKSTMPAGWSEMQTDGNGGSDLCDIDIPELLGVPERSLRKADVQYALDQDTGPSVVESIGLVPSGRAPELLDGLRDGFDDCDGDVQGIPVTATELDFPTLGDDSAAYEIHVGSGQGSIDIPLVYAISGDLVVAVYAIDVSRDPVELLEEYAPQAVDKALRVLA